MKYQQTNKVFSLRVAHKISKNVTPFNAEVSDPQDVSWSHGITHYRDIETGEVGHCGQSYFEQFAEDVN